MLAERRCTNCHEVYQDYGPTSHLRNGFLNDHLCTGCAYHARATLATLPAKFENLEKPTNKVSLSQLLQWAKEELEATSVHTNRVKPVILSRWPPTSKKVHYRAEVYGRGQFVGWRFGYRYCTENDGPPTDIELTEFVRRNLKTGEDQPWIPKD